MAGGGGLEWDASVRPQPARPPVRPSSALKTRACDLVGDAPLLYMAKHAERERSARVKSPYLRCSMIANTLNKVPYLIDRVSCLELAKE